MGTIILNKVSIVKLCSLCNPKNLDICLFKDGKNLTVVDAHLSKFTPVLKDQKNAKDSIEEYCILQSLSI